MYILESKYKTFWINMSSEFQIIRHILYDNKYIKVYKSIGKSAIYKVEIICGETKELLLDETMTYKDLVTKYGMLLDVLSNKVPFAKL